MKFTRLPISNEEIYNLRKSGMSYDEIVTFFRKKGISVSRNTIRNRCKEVFEEKNETNRRKRIKIPEDEIYLLKEQGMTDKEIADYMNKKGIHISLSTLRNRIQIIYKERKEEEPDTKNGTRNIRKISDDEIYELRQKRLGYVGIANYFIQQGRTINYRTVRSRCKKIYEIKGEDEPKLKTGPKVGNHRIEISMEKIYRLRQQGLSYKQISEYFTSNGIPISAYTIQKRCKEIYSKIESTEPQLQNKIDNSINEEIYHLKKKGLTYNEILEHLRGKGISISWGTVYGRCQKIYMIKGEQPPKSAHLDRRITTGLDISEEEICKLKEEGLSFHAIQKHFAAQGKNVSVNTLARRYKERIHRTDDVKETTSNEQLLGETLEKLESILQAIVSKKDKTSRLVQGFEEILREQNNIRNAEGNSKGEEK